MQIRIGTSEIEGTFHRQGEAVAELLRAKHIVEIEPMVGSSVGSALGLHSGDLQFGFSASNWVGRALRGEEPFKEPIAIRMAAPANVGPMFFVVRADSDLHTIDDMIGRKISVNVTNSGMYQHTRTIFGILGISFDQFEPVHMTFEEGAVALKAGDIDAQWQCPIPNPVMTELTDSTDVRVLEYGPGQLEKVITEATFYRQAVIPVGAFRGVDKETPQVGVLNVIATHERVEDALVHEFVTTMIENATLLADRQELYRGLADLFAELKSEGQSVFEPGGVSLHPGAIQAYRDAGLMS
jgi:TRAP transporter TAXI family solute receptor